MRVKLKALEANAASTRSTYDSFVTRLRETQGQEGIVTPDAHVISRAALPLAPNGPGRLVLIGASLPAGLLIGLIAALIAERLSAAPLRHSPAPRGMPMEVPVHATATTYFSPPLVGDIPNVGDRNASNIVVDWPRSPFACAVAQLLLRVAPGDARPRTVVVTSADTRSPSSAVAASLVRAAALSGRRALLIDADLRRPVAAVAMGLHPPMAGLIDVLSGRAPLGQAIQVDPRSNASILSAAKPYLDSHAVFASPLFAELLAHLKKGCQLVVIHAPTNEAMMLERYADAIVILVDKRRLHTERAIQAVQDFAPAGNRVGVVLTS
jgi:succinoglycan biosynthesis transport protein ExoP